MRNRRLAGVLISLSLLVGLSASPATAAADPAGPSCTWWWPGGCDAANWYQDIRGLGMEGSKERLSAGIVAAYGPYLTSANRSSLDKWIAAYGSRASFRVCARDQAVIFASKVANANKYISNFKTLLAVMKKVPSSKTVTGYFKLYESTAKFAVSATLSNEAQSTIGQIGGCS